MNRGNYKVSATISVVLGIVLIAITLMRNEGEMSGMFLLKIGVAILVIVMGIVKFITGAKQEKE